MLSAARLRGRVTPIRISGPHRYSLYFTRQLATHDQNLAIPETVPVPYSRSPPPPFLPVPQTYARPLERDLFWRKIPQWSNLAARDFMSWDWNRKNVVEKEKNLHEFLDNVLPDVVPRAKHLGGVQCRDEFVTDVHGGMKKASMSVRVMPYVLSRINWQDPANDPLFKQYIPLKSLMIDDHPMLHHDSLAERRDSPVSKLVHRYPDKALFLVTSVCPTLCVFCTRAYGVGAHTDAVVKDFTNANRAEMETALAYIQNHEEIHDVAISGGDTFYLAPHILEELGDRLLAMDNIDRVRFASKGLAVAPQRFIEERDAWTEALARLSNKARRIGKQVALHTHFNHPNEISWLTEQASLKLIQQGITVRNQTVLLRGINDDIDTMSDLIRKLCKMAIQPYYIYQCDMVPTIEHLRTPLSTILDLEAQLQGITAGFLIPKCIVDLPGGGGKRPGSLHESYDRETGISTFTQPALKGNGRENKVYKYYDPVDTLDPKIRDSLVSSLREEVRRSQALKEERERESKQVI
ncbi:kama family protein [Hypoxylon fragiforme]|uniref:kama family protein n=1 Tax=Hypoxylon fragiforme TaxID=63214 RepID=UPI0020C5CC16|nr:kama family protein [Hypoxylon fragiforme]KAI2607659.1 kama family protein [Hypoxylon fragiforme]